MVSAIYDAQAIIMDDLGSNSRERPQQYGTCQGCPLSPFLFTIVMTTLLADAHAELHRRIGPQAATHLVRDLVYADDTLLIDSDSSVVQELMRCIEGCGSQYGLSFNWGKLELMKVRTNDDIYNNAGVPIANKSSIVYLGTSLSADGRIGSELSRRLGAATQDFKVLHSIWSHARMSRRRKIQIFNACIVSKLLYSLFAACLNKAERQRLDAFQNRCLRRICRIPHAYYSRVSNAAVLNVAGQDKLSTHLARRQLVFMGQLARRPGSDPVRRSVFEPGTLDLRKLAGARRRGRPRQTWGHLVWKNALEVAGSHARLADYFRQDGGAAREWERAVKAWPHC